MCCFKKVFYIRRYSLVHFISFTTSFQSSVVRETSERSKSILCKRSLGVDDEVLAKRLLKINSRYALVPLFSFPFMDSSSSSDLLRGSIGEPAVIVVGNCSDASIIPYAEVLSDFNNGSPYSFYEEEWIPGPDDVSVAHPRAIRSVFDKYLVNGVVEVMSGDEREDADNVVRHPLKGGGIGAYVLRAAFRLALNQNHRSWALEYGLSGKYMLYVPGERDTPMTPPIGCTAVYWDIIKQGMRFPLHPFVEMLLREYNLAICNLTPNAWLQVYAFLVLCIMLEVAPTLRLWRNLFSLAKFKEDFGPGWWTFRVRRGFRVIVDLTSNMKSFRGDFVLIYCRNWDIPLIPNQGDPNLSLNYDIPPMTEDEAVFALCLETEVRMVEGEATVMSQAWTPDKAFLKNERNLCGLGLGVLYPKGTMAGILIFRLYFLFG